MRKDDQDKNLFNNDSDLNKNLESNKVKTTNVNVLLNRVRLDKKRTLKKRIILLIFFAALISSLAVYIII